MVPFRDRVNFFHLITNLFKHYRIKISERKWYAKFLFNLDRKKKNIISSLVFPKSSYLEIYAFFTQLKKTVFLLYMKDS